MRRSRLFAVLLGIVVLSPDVSDALPEWAAAVEEVRLGNGMKFLLYVRGEAPIFSAMIRFRTGGMDEEEGKTGLAHFMEHMAFKGTERLDGRTLGRMIEEAGGQDYNATTSKDMTTYVVSLPSERLRFWAEIESERIFRPAFREFEAEKNVILEERRMRVENDPEGKFYETFLQTAYRISRYRWPTIGTERDLRQLTVADLEAFWRDHYRPSNATGVLVGNFDPAEARKILIETFGKIHPGEGDKKQTPPLAEPPQGGERRLTLKLPARSRLWIGFHKPTLPEPDDFAFDLLNEIVGEGRSARLYKRLVLQEKVASGVQTSSGTPGSRLPNLFFVEVDLLPAASPERVLRLIDDEIAAVKKEGVTPGEMEKARNRLAADILWGMKTNHGMASQLSYYEVIAGDWRYLANYLEEISRFGPGDLRRIAKTYLIPSNRTVAVLKPDGGS